MAALGEVQPLADELCELAAQIHSAQARLAELIAALDQEEGWAATGLRSCAHWLSINAGLDLHSGSELLRVGQALERLPLLAAAFAAGELSLDKARAVSLVAGAGSRGGDVYVPKQTSVSQLSRIVREFRRALVANDPEVTESQLARRGLWTYQEDDGMLRLLAQLPPEDGAAVLAAISAVSGKRPLPLDSGAQALDPAEDRWAAQRADALVAICEHALAAGGEVAGGGAGRQVVVHVDVALLNGEAATGRREVEAGPPVAASVARRLGCDAEVVAVLEREGLPIDVGRRRRIVSDRLRLALHARDRGCLFPGCSVPARRTQGHHLEHWAQGGRTDLANLLSLCGFHHRRLHEGTYRIVAEVGGGLRFESADGRLIGLPLAVRVDSGSGGGAQLRQRSRASGRRMTSATAGAGAGGAPHDLQDVVDAMIGASGRFATGAGPAP